MKDRYLVFASHSGDYIRRMRRERQREPWSLPKGAHAPADTTGPTETTGETWLVSGQCIPEVRHDLREELQEYLE